MKTSHSHAASHTPAARRREKGGERGAALITALLMTTLLLSAGGALILTSSMAATTAADSTAEMQAYYAAEAGLEASLLVMRRNLASNTSPAMDATFRNFVCGTTNPCMNTGGDFSQWLTYNSGRITLDATNKLYYSLSVRDAQVEKDTALPTDPAYSTRHVIVTSTGYGPKGAQKVLEMTVDSYGFDFTARAAVAIRSNDVDANGMAAFTVGTSNPHLWNGNDLAGLATSVPAFAVTNTADYDAGDGIVDPDVDPTNLQGMGEAAIGGDNTNILGQTLLAKLAPANLETWLQTAGNARTLLSSLRARAETLGRYNPTSYGTDANPLFSFVDGDFTFNGNSDTGAGLLVVTGKYTQGGSSTFHGLILVLGDGVVERNGNPDIQGALLTAKFEHNYNAGTGTYTGAGDFLSPSLTVSGGGNSLVGYNSEWVRKAMESLGPRPTGIVEK